MLQIKNTTNNKNYNLSASVIKQLLNYISNNISYKDNVKVLYGYFNVYVIVNNNLTNIFYLLELPNYIINDYETVLCFNCPDNPEEDPIRV